MNRLVNQFLEIARLENGEIKPDLEPLALPPIIEQVVGVYRSRYNAYDFQVHVPPTLPFALGDRGSVGIMLENLLQNAVKYSPAGSRVTVAALA